NRVDLQTNVVEETVEIDHTESNLLNDSLEQNSPKKVVEESEKILQLPLTRIKKLMKLDPDVHVASNDAAFLIAKATEMFVSMLGQEAYKFTKQNKKKTIQKKDINDCISACEPLAFLEGTLKDDV
ncbi:DNA polymerase epsilon subunit 4-like, partial [Uloborus diversus]|uniref:DNA polymerase epsilon subunit 4-like n=1 Tax=Uloborus diversus TaxID=327109 RepID=UPI00240940F5